MNAKHDVVIIGSGISSLTCAILLAQCGRSVLVLEQHYKPGGYMHSFRRFGHSFDTGAHYVGAMDPGQPFYALLQHLGVDPQPLFVPLDSESFDVFHFPDLQVSFAKGYAATVSGLIQQFPEEAEAIREYFVRIQQAANQFPTYQFNESYDMMAMASQLEVTLSQVVESLTNNPALQSVFYAYCTLHGVQPHEISFGFHAIVTDSLIRGPYGFRNTGDGLANALVARLEELGGKVLLKKRVTELEVQDSEVVSAITADGEHYQGTEFICGIHPRILLDIIDESLFSPAFRKRLNNLPESLGIFGIYGVGGERWDLRPDRNYYYFSSPDPKQWLGQLDSSPRPNVAFLTHPDRQIRKNPRGTAFSLHVPSPASWFKDWKDSEFNRRPQQYKDFKQQYTQRVFEFLEEHNLALSHWVPRFATSSPLTNEHYNPSPEGSAYGIYHSIQNTGARAIGPRTKIHNLLLTGQNTLFPGLLGSAVAGLRTTGHILGIKPLLRQLRERMDSSREKF